MAHQTKARIISNKLIGESYGELVFESNKIARSALPGQFVNIKVDNSVAPFLRRPFGIHRVNNRRVSILYEILGKATEILSRRKSGGYLDVLGPLGHGFDYGSPVIIAGGMGVAPLFFLAEKLAQDSKFTVAGKPIVLLGAKTKKQVLCEKEFKKLGCDVTIATDDGSRGFKGKVTDLLRHFLSNFRHRISTSICACGPRPMLKEISRIAKKYNIPAQVSLEEHMSCGIGACLGCVVNTKDGYKRVCKEGPVFQAGEVIW
jgi:dihydroorotate dehydrogenase electron transfer subunit